jgi:hypothetical protein
MRRRPLSIGISWLLALVLMRSLIPAGFMPAWVDGAFTLILCDGHSYSAGPSAHQHHHHPGAPAQSGTAHSPGDECSYAQSASPALAFNLDLTPAGTPLLSWTTPAFRAGVQGATPLRYASARGPPALA